METVNSQQAQRVWQRVHGAAQEPDEINRLIAEEWETSAACLQLARRAAGKYAPILRQLAQNSRSRWACLQGAAALDAGKRPRHTHPGTHSGNAREILSKCCRDGTGRIQRYAQCSPQLGPVAQLLAQEQTRDCRLMLEILGNWEL